MAEITAKVNEFVGPTYTKGYIGFRYNGTVVPYYIGNYSDTAYHLDMVSIDMLANNFPQYIQSKEKGMKATDWGYKTEIGLCKLMLDNKLKLVMPNEKGERILVNFEWEGSLWDPHNRPTRRKK
ncbi:hypothetical protein [Lysinibacillus antri]|uniref:Uncharacterized protein n=1 Tax=Lysinibacillus antri TaxID=2498145 RepID=A0A3S0P1J1_9BACI|nr:hypothetical protein [Lysinibacillus antri]RUL45640.1 hypothetical protein EK386_19490 [Lysinibacillus antri]